MQSTITDEQGTINIINKILAERIGTQKYRIWFQSSTTMSLADGYIKIGVPNIFMANWIESHFADEIGYAVRAATGENKKLTFTIETQLSGHQIGAQRDTRPEPAVKRQNGIGSQVKKRPGKRLKLSFKTFVVGKTNELAFNAAKAVAEEKKSPFNPLFIHGGYGVGKTHLLQGICNAVSEHRPGTNWLYLSAENFANQFILALKTRKLEAFRRRMRQTDLLAIDDIHFLASKTSTQEEFLHTFNTIDLAGKQVVLACDAHPKMIGQLSEKLVNRFISGMVVKINQPDFQTRCRICAQYAKVNRRFIPESVIRYTAEHIRSNVRELEGALLKLFAYSTLQGKKINIHMAREILAEHIIRADPIVHLTDITSSVAGFFGTTQAELHSAKKDRTIALARHFGMYLARKHTKMSSPEVGRCMGNKNHATVLMACKNIEDLLKRNVELHWMTDTGNKVSKARTVLNRLEESILN